MIPDTYRHKGLRRQLVRELRKKGIADEKVLAALEKVPRHYFFDSALLEHAYEDKAFPIGEGQTISQPYTVAFQTELLAILPGCKVLEIGTGSGYQAAILAELQAELYSIEFNRTLFEKAAVFFNTSGYQIRHFCGDGSLGLPRHAPFDRILVTAGCPAVPKPLLEQLAVDGILIVPVGNEKTQKMLRIKRLDADNFEKEAFNDFCFVPLLGKNGWQ